VGKGVGTEKKPFRIMKELLEIIKKLFKNAR